MDKKRKSVRVNEFYREMDEQFEREFGEWFDELERETCRRQWGKIFEGKVEGIIL